MNRPIMPCAVGQELTAGRAYRLSLTDNFVVLVVPERL